ncbi:PAS domain-containing protein [Thalassovita aquimarina]|uniref:PAS domain-containing protein n=1 Tax=Thalassovita aquimarina TaxID=2785917 RepID=A0ABS5HSX8_9RHOB|nr:PAS domain-containing protein [Thalassovita aquimarina]MBR9652013.1 PAS domain-containing protein [Thalassovita aquimarina]
MNTMTMREFDSAKREPRARAAAEVNVEEPFNVEEMFFSRTDKRGVIEAYNSIFIRVSGFSSEELKGAPHKLIRHSDMPKGVFWLLWNGLESGVPVGAYVKNKTKDGRYYWVFALATPVEGGHLSMRIKPTSPQLALVEQLYRDIRKLELEEKLSAEDSARLILSKLAELGFDSYGAFQAHALHQEFEARRKALGMPAYNDLRNTETIAVTSEKLRHELDELTKKFKGAELLTANMKIFAAKLAVGRATINEIAKNYDLMLNDIRNHLNTLVVPLMGSGIWDAPKELSAYFMICASHLMTEMCEFFESQKSGVPGVDCESEKDYLIGLQKAYDKQSQKAVEYGVQSAASIQRRAEFLRRMVLGLSTIRIACRVEAGMLRGKAKGLETIVSRLDVFHDEIEAHLETIQQHVSTILLSADDFA